MKIAFCLGGQLRTWDKCHNSWELLFKKLKEKLNNSKNEKFEVDYFIHTWDFNTCSSSTEIIDISQIELDEMLNILKPKKHLIENLEKSKSRENVMNSISKNGKSHLDWAASQLYSIMMSAYLKKEYEIENKFKYDVCIRSRIDLNFDENDIRIFSEQFEIPKKRTVYTVWNSSDCFFRWPHTEIGDIFYYCDSPTFDLMTSIYDNIPYIPYGTFPVDIKFEEIMPYFIRMFMLNNNHLIMDPDIVR